MIGAKWRQREPRLDGAAGQRVCVSVCGGALYICEQIQSVGYCASLKKGRMCAVFVCMYSVLDYVRACV